jgi:hypothetical protein
VSASCADYRLQSVVRLRRDLPTRSLAEAHLAALTQRYGPETAREAAPSMLRIWRSGSTELVAGASEDDIGGSFIAVERWSARR